MEHHGGCPFDRLQGEVVEFTPAGNKPKFDLSDLIEYGQAKHLCPYYMARNLAATADLVICPYNYVLSPWRRFPVTKATVAIFDEGHNMDNISRDEASFSVTCATAQAACKDASEAPPESDYVLIFRFISKLTECWQKFILQKRVEFDRLPPDTKYLARESVRELLRAWDITLDKVRVMSMAMLEWVNKIEMDPKGYHDYYTPGLLGFADEIASVLGLITEKTMGDFRVAFIPGEKPEWDKLAVLCMRPATVFAPVAAEAGSVLLSSGTLSPLDSFANELETPFEVRLQAPHVVPERQIMTLTINRADGVLITSQYRHMQEKGPETLAAIGSAVAKIIAQVHGGALLFMPSYSSLRQLLQVIEANGTRSQIEKIKGIVLEESRKTAPEILWELEQAHGGGLFVGVSRGKMSEGVDFPDDKARVVFVFGIPYASFREAEFELKMKYNDEARQRNGKGETGREWYDMQAFRAIAQSIGRCVRHERDYGAIILMDWRMDQNMSKFPPWMRRNVLKDVPVDQAVHRLKRFYAEMRHLGPIVPVGDECLPRTEAEAPPPLVVPLARGLFCANCGAAVITIGDIGKVQFEWVQKRGFLGVVNLGELPKLFCLRISSENTSELCLGVQEPTWCGEDGCAYGKLCCGCDRVLGVNVVASSAKNEWAPGSHVLIVSTLSMDFDGRRLGLEALAKLMNG
jgi:Fanconi anemia group J protein